MSKIVKIVLGVIAALLVVALVVAPLALRRGPGMGAMARGAPAAGMLLFGAGRALIVLLLLGSLVWLIRSRSRRRMAAVAMGPGRNVQDLSEEQIIAAMRAKGIRKLELDENQQPQVTTDVEEIESDPFADANVTEG